MYKYFYFFSIFFFTEQYIIENIAIVVEYFFYMGIALKKVLQQSPDH